ncbi:MAG: dihydrofolate reductase family protein [Chloroflexi bacterium]|nr:dihydrofolate reductase family protein [Chloroflexota bacterium]
MVEVSYLVAASLDGRIADAAGGVGWLDVWNQPDEDYGLAAFAATVDVIVMGRRTYAFCRALAEWPYPEHVSVVCSRTPLPDLPPRARATADAPELVARGLAAAGHRHAWLLGGGQLAAAWHARGLISQMVVVLIPEVLGAGPALIDGAGPYPRMQLVDAHPYANGVVRLAYRPMPDA